MAARPLKIAGLALGASTIAIQLSSFLDPSGTTAAASVEASPPLDGAALQILLPFIVMEALFAAIPFVYRRAHHAAAHGARVGGRRLSELLAFFLCVVVGLLELFFFVQPAGGAAVDGGAQAQARALGFAGLRAQARALGLGALRALPASAAATLFLGVGLVYAHLVGGGNGPVPELAVRVLAEITLEAAAALIGIMAMAICAI